MTTSLGELTTVEAATAVTASPVVLVPSGAFEQHGSGLPLATDTVRAESVAELVAAELGGKAVVGPSIPVGVSPHHLAFAGTLTLSTRTFAAVVTEYVDGLYRHGWRKILVVNGHGGNGPALGAVAQDLLTSHPDLEFAWSPLTSLATDVVAEMDVSEVHGHSGEAETAQLLHLAPHLVHKDRLTPGATSLTDMDALARLARRSGGPKLALRYDQLSGTGVLGDPTRATTEDGKEIVDTIVERLVAFVTDWLDT